MQKSAEKSTSTKESGLSTKQQRLITELAMGKTIKDASSSAGISERAAYAWLKQPLFQSEYQAVKQLIFDTRLETLREGIDLALDTLKRNMTDAKPPVQVRAAQIWLEQAIQVHKSEELEERLKELEEAVREH